MRNNKLSSFVLHIVFSSSMLIFSLIAFAQERKPNVLLITIDDLNDWVGYLDGHPKVQTPNIDQLANSGLAFTNAHVKAPICKIEMINGEPYWEGKKIQMMIKYQWFLNSESIKKLLKFSLFLCR